MYTLSLPAARSVLPLAPYIPASAEAELVAQLQQGSEEAFRTLVEQYQHRVYRTVLALVRSPEDAEDVAQEVFVEVYQTIDRFRSEAALSTWLYRLATSRALKHQQRLRAQKRFAYFTSLLGLNNQVLHEPPDYAHPQAQLEGQQQVELLRAHIARLPGQQQVAFTLRHEQELSYEEIAAVLNTTVPGVESLLFRARKTLRHYLSLPPNHV
ncbi:sigma-70 family RNA polymerase sigma factor [Hymenobacter taeanensis]|uniref:Sigma-70 family RNA polymerase sigma factor n=1 Tax=Hymenobacter taeanensis TaxID=2735321 RepID=A0A6M6BJL6_9BACT|nr:MULTISPECIES: sigma-70 family RNA polymerase sigma factor [Hymenobacter]QJX47503.1 sigma-70 family RNA polymerase sigma factor [Hymenobacter taeanensis]UOQ83014.1 sigma-70 family RNA polymerase sigma factor [Hymenobacter sp. 5414T-23]